MTLENLLGISLESITPDRNSIQRLLAAAERNLSDATVSSISNETRFDAAYKSIMQLANVSLQAKGYRTLTSKPGHHLTMIQSLAKTIHLDRRRIITLDALRKQRNVADYSGDLVSDTATRECIEQAEFLLSTTRAWLINNMPELLSTD